MRLIDADELENFAHEECFGTDEMIQNWIAESDLDDEIKIEWEDQLVDLCWKVLEGCMNVIATQPTAFNVEVVLKTLESQYIPEVLDDTDLEWNRAISVAIEIIRKGGVK